MSKKLTVADVIAPLERLAPKSVAESWDFVGLQVGSLSASVTKVLCTLDVRENTVQEAISCGANLIVAHHPLLFKPLRPLDTTNVSGRIISQLIKHNITVYAAHTNLDKANGGMNDWLAATLNLKNISFLTPETTFSGADYSLGRIGMLPTSLTEQQFAQLCAKCFDLAGVRLITANNTQISTVAVLGGSGGSLLNDVVKSKADAYVSGDISYHTAQDFAANGVCVVDVGHNVEAICQHQLAQLFKKNYPQLAVSESHANTNPYQLITYNKE